MHPIMKPALRRGWRDLNTVQFGMTPAHAMVLGPMDTATGSFLELLDGTRGLPLLREQARAMGLPDGHVDGLVDRLAGSGLLDDTTGGGPAADALCEKQGVMDRLRPDLASLSLVAREPGAAVGRLAARRRLRVRVLGAGRVGVVLAALLAGAGVGEVEVRDLGRVEPWDVAPGGLPVESIGERREDAARRAVRRAAPDRPPRTVAGGGDGRGEGEKASGLSLVILAPRDGLAVHAPDPASAEDLIVSGTPHLYAGVVEATGVVGPLVLPGDTGCAGCLDLRRTDADPVWPRLVAQWRSGRQRRVAACDLALAAAVAGLAASHALAFLDGDPPSCAGTRWETSLPGCAWRAKPVEAHPACSCGTAKRTIGERTPEDGEVHGTMAGRQPHAAQLAGIWRAHV
ncbi:TOMM precursor leader peptide-binding protein [Streptomyces sp. NPDC026665]|uniref:TOMM precursor leader peptide-binding protein n=1 Tax=Streptomyces sp. NPDC026665 TaxID=3154798 RepID=UPI0033C5E799